MTLFLWNTDAPGDNSQNMAKISKSYILTLHIVCGMELRADRRTDKQKIRLLEMLPEDLSGLEYKNKNEKLSSRFNNIWKGAQNKRKTKSSWIKKDRNISYWT